MASESEPFRAFHRRRLVVSILTHAAVTVSAAALVIGLLQVVAAAPEPGFISVTEAEAQIPGAPVNAAQKTLPLPTTTSAPPQAPALLPVTSDEGEPLTLEREWTIDIDMVGYQAELDACLWVRMDLGAAAPIVGAHNHCGGGIVLEMGKGDTVTLRGTSLDGVYEVTEARDAFAGDYAVDATEGMAADVILQTCYWEGNGRALLLGLERAG